MSFLSKLLPEKNMQSRPIVSGNLILFLNSTAEGRPEKTARWERWVLPYILILALTSIFYCAIGTTHTQGKLHTFTHGYWNPCVISYLFFNRSALTLILITISFQKNSLHLYYWFINNSLPLLIQGEGYRVRSIMQISPAFIGIAIEKWCCFQQPKKL